MNEKISIQYKTHTGSPSSISIPRSSKIEDLKKVLATTLQASPDSLSISLPNTKSLSDSQTLKSLNLTPSSCFLVSSEISEVPYKDFYSQLLKKIHGKDLATFIEIIEEWEESFDVFSLLNSANAEGWTLMHFACYKGTSDIVEYLSKRGAMCNSESDDAWTPLQLACYNGHTECIRFLIKHPQLQINRSTSRGTALHQASRRGQSKDLCILLDKGASMTIEDSNGLIPLQVASNGDVFEIIPKYMGLQLISSVTKKENSLNDLECEVSLESQELVMKTLMSEGNLFFYLKKNLSEVEFKVIKIIDIYDMREITPTLCVFQGRFGSLEIKLNSCRETIQNLNFIINFCHIHKIGYVEVNEIDCASPLPSISTRRDSFHKVSISNFQIIETISESQYGNYYSAYLNDNSSLYLIKQVSKSKVHELNKTIYFVKESRILQQVRHNSIVRLYYAFQTRENLYFVLENLKSNITQMSFPTPLPSAKNMIAQIIAALEYLHSRDIVYRNLSPNNIWLDIMGNVKLMNFETAKEGVNLSNKTKSFVGTLGFIPPEYLSKEGHEKPADIYSLGPCLYYMLTGASIFQGEDVKSLLTSIKMGNYSLPFNFPSEVKDFINKVMQKEPKLRPSIESLKNSAFLRDVNWNDLNRRKVLARRSTINLRPEAEEFSLTDAIVLEEDDPESLYEDVEEFDYFGSFY